MLGVRRSSVRRSQCAALLSNFSSACASWSGQSSVSG
jgi:hypothetical protein